MKVIQLFIVFLSFNLFYGQEKPILKIDDDEVYISEFEQIYWKNKKENIATKEDLDNYIQLFVNFKLKVKAAEEMGLDTSKKFKDELAGYRVQLERPYLIDTSINENLINEAYYRTVNEVSASHIMVKLSPNPNPKDTLAAFRKIEDIRLKINSGIASFEELAEEVSEDPSAKFNKGNLGYFNAFKMVYPFECAAYNTPVGKISKIIRSKYGYHLVKPNNIRKAKGRTRTSHIMITINPKTKDIKAAENKINSIYEELTLQNKKFEALANEYSEDRKSAKRGGEIGWVSSADNFYPSFKETVFSLKEDEEFSKPFQTPNGWHIVKRLEFEPIGDLNSMRYELKNKIQKDSRAQKTKASFINKLKAEYNTKESFKPKILFDLVKKKGINNQNFKEFNDNKVLKTPILTFNDLSFSNIDFIQYLIKGNLYKKCINNIDLLKNHFQKFVAKELIEYEKTQLEKKHPDFRALMKEYRDGILLFEISDQKIWSKAVKDTTGLKKYFNNNRTLWQYPNRINGTLFTSNSKKIINRAYKLIVKGRVNNDSIIALLNKEDALNISYKEKYIDDFKNYNTNFDNLNDGANKPIFANGKWYLFFVKEKLVTRTKEFNEAEGIIVSGYQSFLEESWLRSLKEKYNIEINYDILYSIKEKP
jgi:peptidyl-prolyl cis-trans isomerase SurA